MINAMANTPADTNVIASDCAMNSPTVSFHRTSSRCVQWKLNMIRTPTQTIADRKSTRLNSSHLVISYAVFCLKKKKIHTETRNDLKAFTNLKKNIATIYATAPAIFPNRRPGDTINKDSDEKQTHILHRLQILV